MIAAVAFLIWAGSVGMSSPVIADAGTADPYIDQLTEEADTPTLNWAGCEDGFVCATAQVPLDYNRPHDAQIELALIKLPAADPSARIGTLFINFGGPGQSGVDRLRARARWPWLFSEELRSRFDLVSWDQRGVSRSAGVRCFSGERCRQHAGPILDHVSSANSARDLELLRRAVGDSRLTFHGISYGTQFGAIYANLFPGRVRAMVLDGSIDFVGNVTGHGPEGTEVPLNTRQDIATGTAAAFEQFLRDCSAAGPRCAFSQGDPQAKWAALAEQSRRTPVTVDDHVWTYPEMVVAALSLAVTEDADDGVTVNAMGFRVDSGS